MLLSGSIEQNIKHSISEKTTYTFRIIRSHTVWICNHASSYFEEVIIFSILFSCVHSRVVLWNSNCSHKYNYFSHNTHTVTENGSKGPLKMAKQPNSKGPFRVKIFALFYGPNWCLLICDATCDLILTLNESKENHYFI